MLHPRMPPTRSASATACSPSPPPARTPPAETTALVTSRPRLSSVLLVTPGGGLLVQPLAPRWCGPLPGEPRTKDACPCPCHAANRHLHDATAPMIGCICRLNLSPSQPVICSAYRHSMYSSQLLVGVLSERYPTKITSGAAQGCPLSPILFLIVEERTAIYRRTRYLC